MQYFGLNFGIILLSLNICLLYAAPPQTIFSILSEQLHRDRPRSPIYRLPTLLSRPTEVHNFEVYDKCQSSGHLNVIRVVRDESFFQNMSCLSYYSTAPLALETLAITIGDRPQILTPIVNFTITNQVKGDIHYEIHEGIVANGDLINATVSKVKVFREGDFQGGCPHEPGLKSIKLLSAEISFKAPYGDYEFSCQAVERPGFNIYTPGIVFPEVLGLQIKSEEEERIKMY